MKIKSLFVTALAFLVIAGSAYALEIGKEAPGFTLTDSFGNEHSLADFRGKYVVLEWINFGCPFVEKHYDTDNMQKLQKKYTDDGVIWLSICSSAEGKQGFMEDDEINEMMEDYEMAATAYLIDESGKVGKKYNSKNTPTMYIIDPAGELVYYGGIDDKPSTDKADVKTAKNYVAEALDAALAGKEIPNKVTKPYGCSVKYKD